MWTKAWAQQGLQSAECSQLAALSRGLHASGPEGLTDGALDAGGDKPGPSTTSREQTSAEQLPRREAREKELHIALDGLIEMGDANEVLNERAVTVMRRMSDKLTGRDFMQDGLLGEQACRHMPARIDSTYTVYIKQVAGKIWLCLQPHHAQLAAGSATTQAIGKTPQQAQSLGIQLHLVGCAAGA